MEDDIFFVLTNLENIIEDRNEKKHTFLTVFFLKIIKYLMKIYILTYTYCSL